MPNNENIYSENIYNRRNADRFSPPAVGASSLLVIFAVLCLTIFALLSVSSVQADERLSRAYAQTVAGYYAAETEAEEILARLRAGDIPPNVSYDADADIYSYACIISDTQRLAVQVRVNGAAYRVISWQQQSTVDWTTDDTLELWLPEDE